MAVGGEASAAGSGPLAGVRVVEISSLGPGPHCVRLLASLGADVVRIEREGPQPLVDPNGAPGRGVVRIDMKSGAGRTLVLAAVDKADVLVEGFRPGVMERLGFGPEALHQRNPQLVYARMTGWGQTGPLAQTAGHDITYLAVTGALAALGEPGRPPRPPLNLVGDYGGGSLFLAFGIVAALLERVRSGTGQVVDAAIVDGVTSMMAAFVEGGIALDREVSLLGGAAPFYRCYECADGRDLAVGAIEPHFYRELLSLIGAPATLAEAQYDSRRWPEQAAVLEAHFQTKSRDDWATLLAGSDACAAPVLTIAEAAAHPQMQARTVCGGDGRVAAAPRFSRTPGAIGGKTDGLAKLKTWGVEEAEHYDE